ncbi:MAG: CBS domain-containing protein [Candidatus Bathyarchaeia archaeon]|jgi:CBS domain-containing protein
MSVNTVQEVFSTKYASVNQDDTLSACLSLFKHESTPVLVVLNSKGKYAGVIAHRWIIRSRHPPATTKVDSLMRPAPMVSPQDSLSKVAKLMITSGINQLPVFSEEQLVGIVTDDAVIQGAVIGKWGNTKIEGIMTKKPYVIEQDEPVGAAINLFREHGISHAPVVSDGNLVGIISIQNVIASIFQPKESQKVGEIVGEKAAVLSIPVKGIMSKPVITVLPETLLKDAVETMKKHDISSLVVIVKGRPAGILTKRDILEPLAEMELPKQRITVQFSVKGVEIDDIQRGFIMGDFEVFANKYQKTLEGAHFLFT